MPKHSDYPGVTSYEDRHGKIRWRFRKTGLKSTELPGEPHTKPFDDAYQAAIEGRVVQSAKVVRLPGAAHPASLKAAWRKLRETRKWKALDQHTQDLYTRAIEKYLAEPVAKGMTIGDGPVTDLKPRHVAAALDVRRPAEARTLLTALKKLMKIAILEEWIEYDPTYGIEAPALDGPGWQAWPPHVCARFETRWPIGTTPRTAYELAKWLGSRRSDVTRVRWDQLVSKIDNGETVEGFEFVQYKGRNRKGAFAKFHPVTPMLAETLASLDRSTETVLAQPKTGKPYTMQSVTVMMSQRWLPAAGVEKGYSMHGLRKALGGMLADAGATGHQSRDVLGHATMKEADHYAKSRDQARTAIAGMRAVVRLVKG